MTTASSKTVADSVATPPHNGFSLISNEKLLQIYSTMLKCRMLQARIGDVINADSAAQIEAAAIKEAPIAGACLDLLPGDTLSPSHFGYVPSFVKGMALSSIFSALSPMKGKARPRYAHLGLVPPALSLNAQLERVLAVAKENKARKNKKIVVAFCGDATAPPDLLDKVMHESGKRNLPILLVCFSGAETEDIYLKAKECGFPGVIVDGADAVAVYRVATEAITHARRGSGPTLIECKPCIPSGKKSAERKFASDSIVRMEEYLTRKQLFDKKFKAAVKSAFRKELDAAMQSEG